MAGQACVRAGAQGSRVSVGRGPPAPPPPPPLSPVSSQPQAPNGWSSLTLFYGKVVSFGDVGEEAGTHRGRAPPGPPVGDSPGWPAGPQ